MICLSLAVETSGCICFKQQSVTRAYFLFFWKHLSIAGSQKSKGNDKPSQLNSKVFAVSVVSLLNTKAKIALCTVLSGNSTVHLHPPHPTA